MVPTRRARPRVVAHHGTKAWPTNQLSQTGSEHPQGSVVERGSCSGAAKPGIQAFVHFVQSSLSMRSRGFTAGCCTRLLPFQARRVQHTMERPSCQQVLASCFSQRENPSLSASFTIYRLYEVFRYGLSYRDIIVSFSQY